MSPQILDVPVLLIAYRRPDTTALVLAQIKKARPSKLYISINAPSPSASQDELERCRLVKDMLSNIDWDCQVQRFYRESYVDSRTSVEGGIDFLFQSEDCGIILEDDVLPNESFFWFCRDLLIKYKDVEPVMAITGCNFVPQEGVSKESYRFSRYSHNWGLALWRRSWNKYDRSMSDWPNYKCSGLLEKVCGGYRDAAKYWQKRFDTVFQRKIEAYDYAWNYSVWKFRGLIIVPNVNLIKNIGFGVHATHTKTGWGLENLESTSMPMPLNHPTHLAVDPKSDRWTDLYIFRTRREFYKEKYIQRIPCILYLYRFFKNLLMRLTAKV